MSRSWEERVGEYVDAPMLRMRVRTGKVLSCRIHGNFGVYATTAITGRRTKGSCTCPADDRPCDMVVRAPEALSVLGVEGFGEEDEEEWIDEDIVTYER